MSPIQEAVAYQLALLSCCALLASYNLVIAHCAWLRLTDKGLVLSIEEDGTENKEGQESLGQVLSFGKGARVR